MKFKIAFTLLLISVLSSCTRYAVITEEKFRKQTANIANNVYLTTFSDVNSDQPPILLLDPILVNKKSLYLGDYHGLIGVLSGNGFSVWLLHFETYPGIDLKEIGEKLIPQAVSQIQKVTGKKEYILGGVSLGGQAILHYIRTKKDPSIAKAFFLGTGMDYKYTDSFLDDMKKEKKFGTDLSNSCKNKESFCSKYISLDEDNPTTLYLYQTLWNYLPALEENPKVWSEFEAMDFPTLFIAGKIDSVATAESIHPVYRRKRGFSQYYEAGRDNGAAIDYDHLSLFAHEDAPSTIYQRIADWLGKKKGE
ncbi:alpha/beta hydrolase [Leptospira wolffii]|uniref:Alpha/beta hydrolase n=1 Tax=Leptospira wolffii TaxID=409998 RepID=A0A2M9ZDY0_9LEPT|nr:alpha/beta hydrolase [Leptospira wolffii]PJZ66641.1 alpha/beta hydrolase [Leptospira wolffii]TGK61614.1 alpha/beta hydrolase [Leptospira wolffii]TGK70158.1 alpha/beta hydrolase [Leptospira wolffii]TGK77081.1 alpha/beta hydrolase [Leptospira wolffii]TGL31067.1 alpha/beta hydrolase [Leptospira wolffii]